MWVNDKWEPIWMKIINENVRRGGIDEISN